MKFDYSVLIKFSLRNLRRRRKRTFFLVLGLALSNALVIWIANFRYNAHRVLMKNVLGMKNGHEQLTSPGHYDFKKMRLNLHAQVDWQKVGPYLPPDFPYTKRVHAITLLASDYNSYPVDLNGYELERELQFTLLKEVLGTDYRFRSKFPIILGKKLADRLEVKEGEEVSAIGQAVDGSVANENFIVEKIVSLGGGAFELSFAVTSLTGMQEFLVMGPDQAHALVNFGEYPLSRLAKEQGLEQISWRKFLPDMAAGSSFMDKFTMFYAFFFTIVASIASAAAMALSYLERVAEYRMLTVIGTSNKWLRRSMLLETTLVSALSMLTGNLLVYVVMLIFQKFPLDITIVTGGEPIRIGGMVLDVKIDMLPQPRLFLQYNIAFIFAMAIAALYPLKVVLRKVTNSFRS